VKRWLEPLVKRLGVSVLITDDLAQFKSMAKKLDLEHQICQFHVRRWVDRALHELQATVPQEWLWVLDEIKQLLAELPPEGGRCLFELLNYGSKFQSAGLGNQGLVLPWNCCTICSPEKFTYQFWDKHWFNFDLTRFEMARQ
jgi:hypothetical protein